MARTRTSIRTTRTARTTGMARTRPGRRTARLGPGRPRGRLTRVSRCGFRKSRQPVGAGTTGQSRDPLGQAGQPTGQSGDLLGHSRQSTRTRATGQPRQPTSAAGQPRGPLGDTRQGLHPADEVTVAESPECREDPLDQLDHLLDQADDLHHLLDQADDLLDQFRELRDRRGHLLHHLDALGDIGAEPGGDGSAEADTRRRQRREITLDHELHEHHDQVADAVRDLDTALGAGNQDLLGAGDSLTGLLDLVGEVFGLGHEVRVRVARPVPDRPRGLGHVLRDVLQIVAQGYVFRPVADDLLRVAGNLLQPGINRLEGVAEVQNRLNRARAGAVPLLHLVLVFLLRRAVLAPGRGHDALTTSEGRGGTLAVQLRGAVHECTFPASATLA